jgi:hypothetical protein
MINPGRVPLDTAHLFLGTFGIGQPTKAYERWVKPDGFDFDDFLVVLRDSPFVFNIDWRAALPDELGPIAAALGRLGTRLTVGIQDDADAGWITCADNRARVKYAPSDRDDFTDVIRAIQKIIPATIEFRASLDNAGNDGWVFAVLLREEWAALERVDASLVAAMFECLPSN